MSIEFGFNDKEFNLLTDKYFEDPLIFNMPFDTSFDECDKRKVESDEDSKPNKKQKKIYSPEIIYSEVFEELTITPLLLNNDEPNEPLIIDLIDPLYSFLINKCEYDRLIETFFD
jgi:hypothetical protein